MKLVKYRINSPTLALFGEDGYKAPGTVPGGSIVVIDEDSFKENKLVEVLWDGKKVMMFAQDVRARGEEVVD
jgi:hypothetical protein